MFRRLAPALVAALIAGPALAEQMTMDRTIEAVSLHDGPLDMVAYYQPAPGGLFEVTATFAPRTVTMMSAAPTCIVIVLADGDEVAFAVPGYPQARYSFVRNGGEVTASVRPVLSAESRVTGF
jgi:hypothetical protein